MDCKFTIGQKVVCITDFYNQPEWVDRMKSYNATVLPVLNGTYTIREMRIAKFQHNSDVPLHDNVAVLLKEITNPTNNFCNTEFYFSHNEFKPLDEKKTDISIFTSMLNPDSTTQKYYKKEIADDDQEDIEKKKQKEKA